MIYVSSDPPDSKALSLIEKWRSLPSVELFYSGPESLESSVLHTLDNCGILTGGGTPLFIRVDSENDKIAIWMRYMDTKWSNYEDPSSVSRIGDVLINGLRTVIGCYRKPKEGFLVEFSPERVTAKITKLSEPVEYEFKPMSTYTVYLDDVATTLTRGFHEVEGVLFFAGENGLRVETARFFKGTDMIFPVEKAVAVLSSGILRVGKREYKVDMMPTGFWNGDVILPNRVEGKDRRMLQSTAIDVYKGFILEGDGHLEAVDGSWRRRISCTPVEWCWRDEKLYILDVCGHYMEFDLEKERVAYEKDVPGSVGFDFLGGKPLFVYDENFCVVKGEKIFEKCVRLHNGYALEVGEGGISILGRKLFLKAKSFRMINGYLILKGGGGVWLVRFRK